MKLQQIAVVSETRISAISGRAPFTHELKPIRASVAMQVDKMLVGVAATNSQSCPEAAAATKFMKSVQASVPEPEPRPEV